MSPLPPGGCPLLSLCNGKKLLLLLLWRSLLLFSSSFVFRWGQGCAAPARAASSPPLLPMQTQRTLKLFVARLELCSWNPQCALPRSVSLVPSLSLSRALAHSLPTPAGVSQGSTPGKVAWQAASRDLSPWLSINPPLQEEFGGVCPTKGQPHSPGSGHVPSSHSVLPALSAFA